ncbi:GDSL-like lipase/Acylhydrolase family domain-containing protein [Penicillium riverlandense]|uniref:GDSL-like lipase/Acylhydrolase family domain-containing protein n=1 Tax=Penicillium riverlandense TaxID=1903569 RepID=UPI002548E5C8|nr:GDSL-like lipase/Acylhydrolase family domain-containing protein [Penicillium riverlandense]KAJ5812309.1 GDSL-like lipase/Acylhydrolase family domain-containing protein [Penicillium riverlandense]
MAHPNPLTSDKIILFGDSLTEQSWNQEFLFNISPALQHEYFRKLQIVTHGYGGYNSEHARHILEPMLDAETAGGSRIRLLVIFFGTNDAVEAANTRQHIPMQRYAENVRFLTIKALDRGINVILVGPALVGKDVLDRSNETNRTYSQAVKHVAQEHDVPFVDLWTAFHTYTRSSSNSDGRKSGKESVDANGTNNLTDLLAPDGVHFSGQGYHIYYKLLLRTIRESFPPLRPENLPTVLPHIFDIDETDLPESLWRPVATKNH